MKCNAFAFGKSLGCFDTIEEAFIPLYDVMNDSTYSWDEKESSCYIEYHDLSTHKIINVHKATNYMIDAGLLIDGYLKKDLII